MNRMPNTKKPSKEVRDLAAELLKIIVANHSQAILDAVDGEVTSKLVNETFAISLAFHAYEVRA